MNVKRTDSPDILESENLDLEKWNSDITNSNIKKGTDIVKIDDLHAPQLDLYARRSEAELLHLYEPGPGVFIAESPKVIERALASGCRPVSVLCEEKQAEEAATLIEEWQRYRIPIYTAPLDVLTRLTGFALTRGMLCAMQRPEPEQVERICRDAARVAVLEQIMNPTNVGAIFRSAAALEIDAVLLTHGCSDPLYRRAIRVSMGTVFQIPWAFFPEKGEEAWPEGGLSLLHRLGFRTVAMALGEDTVSIEDPRLMAEEKLAIVLGSEGDGLGRDTIAACDYRVRIPMAYGVDSLNVAAASAVAFWQLGRRGRA